ncbi:MAG: hypothetical protein AAF125_27925, partial [Chloroflexota bacterium]
VEMLAARGGVPVIGVMPYLHDLGLPEEDAVAVEAQNRAQVTQEAVDIAVIALPRIANFDDFDPLASELGVSVRYVSSAAELGRPNAVVIPGTKSTMADLAWLRATGLADAIVSLAGDDVAVVGICGGYQMLGARVADPDRVESDADDMPGLGLFPTVTTFLREKVTAQTTITITASGGWARALNGTTVSGYEIHMGRTPTDRPWLRLSTGEPDGAMSDNGRVWGCYLHGLFANTALRRAWLQSLGWAGGDAPSPSMDAAFDRLADVIEANLDMRAINMMIGL